MKKIVFAYLLTTVLVSTSAFAQDGHKKHEMGSMMNHANPMPNLMRVVKKHETELGLNKEQSQALADWRMKNHGPTHSKVKQIRELERAMYQASMDGKSKQELMQMAAKLMQLRTEIISGKTDCRDNMRSILNDKQYVQVVAMYEKMYGMN